ncbi:MAG: aminotransferase [Alphaproteobacteria bacterium]|nr:aminotransferase [Alphaproteobacteria bacterium]
MPYLVNPDIAHLNAPPVAQVQEWIEQYHGNAPMIDLSQAVPGYPPHDDLKAALVSLADDAGVFGYGAIEGEPEFRHVYAEHVSQLYGCAIAADQVLISAGCNQAFIFAAMGLAKAGDAVLLPEPSYFNHSSSLAMLGITAIGVAGDPARQFLPDVASFEQAITPQTRAIALVSPNNPTGTLYPADLLDDLFRLCQRHDLALIIDETYRDFCDLDVSRPHGLFDHPDWADTVIQLYSFSKSYCLPGYRLGAVVAGAGMIAELAKITDNIQICAPRIGQKALSQMLPQLAHWRIENQTEIAARRDAFRAAFAALPEWSITSDGCYFGFVRHPYPDRNSAEVAAALMRQTGVLTIPGGFFGAEYEDHLRFAFANADSAAIASLPDRLSGLSF